MAIWLVSFCKGVVIVNVGLPRTGTTSFHMASVSLNLTSQHIAFDRTHGDIEKSKSILYQFRNFGTGRLRETFEKWDAFSDTPCYAIIPALKEYFPDVALVATYRSRTSWLASMAHNPQSGGDFLYLSAHLAHLPYNYVCMTILCLYGK